MASPATPPADAGIRVESLSFCRLECDHGELFLPEYKRSNRTKGLKILRCFPHCCPNHIERSYCGSSLHVLVQTEPSSTPRAKLAESVFLFARFECSTDDGLRVGDVLPSAALVRDTQGEENPEGRWIPGLKERASALASAMRRVAAAVTDATLVYQLNGKVYSRWYYDWESGANKAQRLMRHVLKAYVFEKHAPDALRVLGVVASPEFTVISYRRAPSDALGALAPTLGVPTPTPTLGKADAAPREPSPSMEHDHAAKRELLDAGDATGKRARRRGVPASSQGVPSTASVAVTLRTASPLELFEDRVLWEHAHTALVTVSKNLALVFYFVQWTPLDYYALFVDELVHTLNHGVLEPLADARLEKLNAFARVLLEHAQTQPTSRHRGAPPPVLSRELEALLRAMAHAASWFFAEPTRAWTRDFVQRHADAVTDKSRLRAAFLTWIVELEAQLNRDVFAPSPLRSLANAAEEIIAAVYTHELFHPKRPMVRQILGEHGFLGWRAFVAQMRDSFIAFSSAAKKRQRQAASSGVSPSVSTAGPILPPPPPSTTTTTTTAIPAHAAPGVARPPLAPVPLNPVERAWNGDWVLDVEETSWKPQDAAHPDGLSLLAVLDAMTQLTRVHVTLQLEQRTLSLSSRAAFATAQLDAMKLVLDGKSRVFRFTPHGWSTAMGEGADGDYIASTRFESPERLIVYLETFRWSRMPGARSYHVRMRIECWKQQRLFVNGEVLETISNASFPHEDLQFMPERTVGAKMKMVNRVFVRQPGPISLPMLTNAGPPGMQPSAATAWRRLGGFRLVYARTRR